MKRLPLAALAATALALVACGHVDTFRYPLGSAMTPVTASPAIYFEGNLPQGAMQELAMVEAVGYGTKANTENVAQALSAEASRWGASAVVRVKIECGYGQCHGYGVAVRLVPAQ